MVRLNKLKAAVIAGIILGIMTFSAAYGCAQEEKAGVNTSHRQNMGGMTKDSHETEMGSGSHEEQEPGGNRYPGEPAGDGHEQSQDNAGGGHGDGKGEEPVPWGFLYGFLGVNGAIVVTAGVMKVTKQ